MADLLELGHAKEASLSDVLNALSDPIRRAILLRLRVSEQGCSCFSDLASKTSLSYHFAILRKAGLTDTRRAGTKKMISLRSEALEGQYPGLVNAVLTAAERDVSVKGRSSPCGSDTEQMTAVAR